jgi:hypothetical protein
MTRATARCRRVAGGFQPTPDPTPRMFLIISDRIVPNASASLSSEEPARAKGGPACFVL